MEELDKLVKKVQHNRKKTYFSVGAVYLLLIITFLFVSFLSEKFFTHNKHLTYGVVNLQYLTTQSHLWLEEYVKGDKKEFSKIFEYLTESQKQVDVLLNGGSIRGFDYDHTHSDETISKHLQSIQDKIYAIKRFSEKRVIADNGQLFKLDDAFDQQFLSLTAELSTLDDYVELKFKRHYDRYEYARSFLILMNLILLLLAFFFIRNINKELLDSVALSYVDGLTKLQNKKSYLLEIKKQMALLLRYETPFSIVMFDIDCFKSINDKYGHAQGDRVLIDLSSLHLKELRENDYLYRVGGEEFIVICPNTDLAQAKKVAEKLRAITEQELYIEDEQSVTISLGVAQASAKENTQQLFERVDALLYRSKNAGRNQLSA